jgi:UDP-3-O-[3-hydroxymyristoyl] glucosamine N-acyltransferase
MLIHSNNKPVRILGLGFIAHEVQEFLQAENITSTCIDIDTALADPKAGEYQYLIGTVRNINKKYQIIDWLNSNKLNSPSYVHPQCIVNHKAVLNPGVVCYPFSLVFDSVISDHAFIGPYCHVGHNSVIGTGTVLLPYSYVLGSSSTGKFTVLQTRACMIDHVAISAEFVNVLPAAVITKNIDRTGTYGGSPARYVNSNTSLTSDYFN